MKKKVLIVQLTSPLSFSKLKYEFLLSSINYGLSDFNFDNFQVDYNLIFWEASKIKDDVCFNFSQKINDCNINQEEFFDKLRSEIRPLILKKIESDFSKKFQTIKNSIKILNSQITNHEFILADSKYQTRGYGSIHQFSLIEEHIRKNTEYDYYIFMSSNSAIFKKDFFKCYIEKLDIDNLAMNIFHPGIIQDNDNAGTLILRTENLNTFIVNPKKLLKFIDKDVDIFFKSEEYCNHFGENKISIASSFEAKNGKFIKNYIPHISSDYKIQRIWLVEKDWFPFFSNPIEPAISFWLFYMICVIKKPNKFGLNANHFSNKLSNIKLPKSFIQFAISNYDSIDSYSSMPYGRFNILWEPYITSTEKLKFIYAHLNLDIKVDDSIIGVQHSFFKSAIKFYNKVSISDEKQSIVSIEIRNHDVKTPYNNNQDVFYDNIKKIEKKLFP